MRKMISCLLVLGSLTIIGCNQKNRDQAKKLSDLEKIISIKKGDLRVVVETTGQVVPNQEVEIKCKASGEIIKLPVDISDSVKVGDLLVQLDTDNEERQLKQNEVNLQISKARLQKAQLELEIAEEGLKTEELRAKSALETVRIKVQEAEARFKRQVELNEQKLTTPEELERARSASAQAKTDLISAEARVADLKSRGFQIKSRIEDVRIAEAQVLTNELSLSDAKKRLEDTTVVSPINGIVAERLVQVGQIIASGINNVGGGTRVLSIVDLSRVFIHALVDESDIGKIKKDQDAMISVDAYPGKRFKGIVRRVATKGSVVSNVVTFEVRIEVRGQLKDLLKPQMTANLEIIALEKDDIPLLPAAAVRRKRGKAFVLIQGNDSESESKFIEIGETDGKMVEILAGLDETDQVILPESGTQSRWSRDVSGKGKRDQTRSARIGIRMMGGRSGK